MLRETDAIEQRASQEWRDTGIPVRGKAVVGDVVGYLHSIYDPTWIPCEVRSRGHVRRLSDEQQIIMETWDGFTFGARVPTPQETTP